MTHVIDQFALQTRAAGFQIGKVDAPESGGIIDLIEHERMA